MNKLKNCEECGWPEDACSCDWPQGHPDNPVGIKRCGECGGDHEPTGARTDCIIHWKRRALNAEIKAISEKQKQANKTMKPHQERVIEEKKELDEHGDRLDQFILSEQFQSLPSAEQERLKRQLEIMGEYSEVLGERIAAFTK